MEEVIDEEGGNSVGSMGTTKSQDVIVYSPRINSSSGGTHMTEPGALEACKQPWHGSEKEHCSTPS